MIAKNTATLSELFADEMSSTHTNAEAYTKAAYVEAIYERGVVLTIAAAEVESLPKRRR